MKAAIVTVIRFFASFFTFIRSVFSESDGTGSASRFLAGAIVFSTLGWVSYAVFKNHAIPDLSGPTGFMTAGGGAFYGLNKTSDIVAALKGKQ